MSAAHTWVGTLHGEVPEQIGVDLVALARSARSGPWVQRLKPHQAHQPPHPLAVGLHPPPPQPIAQATASVERIPKVRLVEQAHGLQVPLRDRRRPVIHARTRQRQQLALMRHRQCVTPLDHGLALPAAQ